MNHETFEEKFSFKLSPLNVFVAVVLSSIFIVFVTTYIIAFTSLREYIPGYANVDMQRKLNKMVYVADSLQTRVNQMNKYLDNIKNIISDSSLNSSNGDNVELYKGEQQDMGSGNKNNLVINMTSPLSTIFFYSPIKGIVVNGYDVLHKHYGVDVAAKKNEIVKSVYKGVVIFSGWTYETGYVISIQHTDNIISIYKHNAKLLKSEGDIVMTGEPIAIIGNSGELTTGPHLHFELWYNGQPLNPVDYILF